LAWLLALLLLVVGSTYAGLASAQGDVANRCAVPDALLKAGEKEAARKDYVSLLRRDPATLCARRGLVMINRPEPVQTPVSCRAADGAFEAGRLPDARRKYERLGQDQKCAADGLAAVKEVARFCNLGRAYSDRKRKEDALTAYKAALAKNPKAPCAIAGVPKESGPGWFFQGLDGISNEAPHALVFAAIVIVGLIVLLLPTRAPSLRRRLARRRGLGWLLSPRLTLAPVDDAALGDNKVGTAISARIKERLQRFRDEARSHEESGYELDFGTGDEEFADLVSDNAGLQNALGKVGDLSEHTKIAAALLQLLYATLPIHRLTISSVLDPPAASGASATLSLEDGSRLAAAVTLSGPALPRPAAAPDYLRLSDPAATWVQHEVANRLRGREAEPDEALSYALVREGLDRHLAHDDAQAAVSYEEALVLYPKNWAAIVNLAATKARLKQAEGAMTTVVDGLTAMGVPWVDQ
jgi:tetratricopeptide (TPR) repeat protein